MQFPVPILFLTFFSGLMFTQPVKCFIQKEKNPPVACTVKLKTGDIVLRNGKGWISDFFRNTSALKKEYSHAGIVIASEYDTLIVHIIGGEISSGFRKETLASFCSSKKNTAYAVYRYEFLSGHEKQVEEFLNSVERKLISFDDQFDLKTDSAMYCTELVFKMVKDAGFDLKKSFHNDTPFISIDDLYVRNQANLLFENQY